MLIDIHSHLDHCYFKDDLDKVIENAKKANVKVILTAGTNPEKNKESLKIAENILKAFYSEYEKYSVHGAIYGLAVEEYLNAQSHLGYLV